MGSPPSNPSAHWFQHLGSWKSRALCVYLVCWHMFWHAQGAFPVVRPHTRCSGNVEVWLAMYVICYMLYVMFYAMVCYVMSLLKGHCCMLWRTRGSVGQSGWLMRPSLNVACGSGIKRKDNIQRYHRFNNIYVSIWIASAGCVAFAAAFSAKYWLTPMECSSMLRFVAWSSCMFWQDFPGPVLLLLCCVHCYLVIVLSLSSL